MDVQKLINLKHWLDYSSFTFSLETYVLLSNSLLLLQSENHFKKMFFWGVIQGLDADYFIAFGYEKDALSERKYFYSEDCQNWKLLPVPQKEHLTLTELCKRPFQGDAGFVVEVVDDAPPEDLDETMTILDETEFGSTAPDEREEEGEQSVVGEAIDEEKRSKISDEQDVKKSELSEITSGELKEEDRLAAVIHTITEEAAVVPRGAIYKQTDGISVHSRAFEGIKLEDADSLCEFLHYRVPWNDCNTNLLARCDYNYAMDFLDTIDKDIPEDCWSAQLVEGDRTIILRNLHWPGFMFFHYLHTPDYGFVYVGQGRRNLDIPFMTQLIPIPETPIEELPPEEEEPRASMLGEPNRTSYLSQGSAKLSSKLESILGSKLGTRLSSQPTGTKLSTRLSSQQPSTKLGTRLSLQPPGTRLSLQPPGTRLSLQPPGTKLSMQPELPEEEEGN